MVQAVKTNITTTWVYELKPTTPKGANPGLLGVRQNTGNLGCFAMFSVPAPYPKGPGIELNSAFLELTVERAMTGTTTFTVRELAEPWKPSTVTWSNMPSHRPINPSTTAEHTVGSLPKGAKIVIDVTNIVKRYGIIPAWYGFRIDSNSDTAKYFVGNGTDKPKLIVDYYLPLEKPEILAPGSADPGDFISVSVPKPDLSMTFDPNVADAEIDKLNVQIWTTDLSAYAGGETFDPLPTPTWDSEWQTVDSPTLPLSQFSTAPTISSGEFFWWRMRFMSTDLTVSEWSDIFRVYYNTKGTVEVTTTSPVYDSTPTITWSLTGRTQQFYAIEVQEHNPEGTVVKYETGRVASTATSVGLPKGIITKTGVDYTVRVLVWDTFNRQVSYTSGARQDTSTAGTRVLQYQLSDTVSPVTSLASYPNSPRPQMYLTWDSAEDPDFFEVVRDGVVVETDIIPEMVRVSGTSFKYLDTTAPPKKSHVWEVRRKVGSTTSSLNPTVEDDFYTPLLWLSDKERDLHIPIAGEAPAEISLAEQGATFEPLNSKYQVRVTGSLGGHRGKVNGVLCGECLKDGTTSQELQVRLLDFRENVGAIYYFYLDNLAIPVVIYNVSTFPLYGARFGKSYGVSFDWHEVEV